MGIFNTIMLAAATPILPPEITAYNYNTIQEINPYCYRIEFSIDGNSQPIDFLKIENANEFTAIMYCHENYSQEQENNNHIVLNDSYIYSFDSSSGWWVSLAELQNDVTTNYYSIICDNTIDFSVVIQRQRVDNYNIGYEYGYKEGYNIGYNKAASDSNVGSYDWLTSIFNTLKTIFELELLPGLKLGYLIGIPFVITLVAFIISWFR